jgi:hypothetical protein
MMRTIVLVGLLTMAALTAGTVFVGQAVWDRVRSKPIDMSEVQQRIGVHAPRALTSIIKRDGIAFHAHALLASFIEHSSGDPAAAGVQWVKAAAHARTTDDLQQVIEGLRWGRDHSADRESFQSTICSFVEGNYWSGLQREAFTELGLNCPRLRRRD